MMKAWSDADADGDGKLNFAEHQVWENAMRAAKEAEGEWNESEHTQANYDIANSVGEGDGYTMAELMAILGPWARKFEELKNADGQ